MSKVFTIAEGLENLGALRTGGQGSVYKGRRYGPIYSAVKLIPTPIYTENEDDKNYRNYQNEVTKLQKVNENPNPNVVKILSSGITESGSFPFIEMEYIEGPDLAELLHPPHDKIFTLKELIKVADQLAFALAHCHKVGVKHGDIKSNNVKYNIHTGNYVLLDFGLAIMSEEQRRSSIRHAGAIEFMAPEQHEGKMLMQTDIYSYGVILYELLTGQVPFALAGDGDTGRNAVMLSHMEQEIPDALNLRSANLPAEWNEEKKALEMQVPLWFTEILYKCLQKKPEDRFADGIELHNAIISGSISASAGPGAALSAVALETENSRLLEQLASFKGAAGTLYNHSKDVYERDPKMAIVPKKAITGLIAIAGLCLSLFLYKVFSANDHIGGNPYSYQSPYVFFKPYNVDSMMKAEREHAIRARLDSIDRARAAHARKNPPEPQRKKRKKFLGLF
ncbi:serine/threonine protein kinase [Mucilaginibacter calamicampi]|uniref:Serine/threonine protein kinase n=1 Tax=Mucilaginibacter calamicampi TaxID=1302352 RepID=A0ABW2YZE0_9SPHI